MQESSQTTQMQAPRHVDRPEITEVYVDGVYKTYCDGINVRIEFTVNRFDDPPSNYEAPRLTGTAVTAARLVISVPGLLLAMQQFNALITSLQQQGTLRQIHNPPSSGQSH